MDVEAILKKHIESLGYSHFGFTSLAKPLTMDIYRAWLDLGLHASMKYLEEHAETKENSSRLAPRARGAIVIAKRYLPHPYPSPGPKLRTALYAQGADYHNEFKRELEELASGLKLKWPSHEFLCFTDSAPILERDLAYRAGLGWVGKNTCLIHPERGSLFFLGEILTSLELKPPSETIKDFCGTCDKCLRACPTGALLEPRKLDANLCIAYWTIEAQGESPPHLREKFGDWFFGCDLCQTICPWNEKAHGRDLIRSLHAEQAPPEISDLRWILESSNKSLEKAFADSPLIRARPRGLKRNAIRLVGQRRIVELRTQVEHYKDDSKLGEIASWALARLS